MDNPDFPAYADRFTCAWLCIV